MTGPTNLAKLQLVSVSRPSKHGKALKALYKCYHSTPGGQGTCLEVDLVVSRDAYGTWTASIDLKGDTADTPEEAMLGLGKWLARTAEALETCKHTESIPLSGTSREPS